MQLSGVVNESGSGSVYGTRARAGASPVPRTTNVPAPAPGFVHYSVQQAQEQ
jgi:hypothetical protein